MPSKNEFHPIADLFPLMTEEELEVLAADIKANGLGISIVLYQGKVLDGRNRYLACLKADVEPTFAEYTGNDPLAHSLSLNLQRRHLTTAQRAAVAADVANLRSGQRADYAAASNEAPVSQSEAAELLNVSRSAVQRAATVRTADAELHEKVKAGEVTLQDAARAIAPNRAATSWTAPSVRKSRRNAMVDATKPLSEKTFNAFREAFGSREKEIDPPAAETQSCFQSPKSEDHAAAGEPKEPAVAPEFPDTADPTEPAPDSPQSDSTYLPRTDDERMVSDFKHFIADLARRYSKSRVEVKEFFTSYLNCNSGWLRESTSGE
jgi:ParB-like chromosome segregation protein Spo0J